MKTLEFCDISPEDSLQLILDCAFNPQATPERELEPFLRVLEEHAGEWMPDVINGKR